MNNKYKLTTNEKTIWDMKLYQIEALKDFWIIKKGDLWWWIEKEDNLSHNWDATVSWNATVYWNARAYWAYKYTSKEETLDWREVQIDGKTYILSEK